MNHKRLRLWFEEEKREFPWRKDPSPYRVWVSEVMLQQTRASVVIPYFVRWMEQFPTIEALANASIEEVVKAWEGLGYYSRARALHTGAKYLMETSKGELPTTRERLLKVKGIGPYTAGAILSFAFHKKAAAVDGNVLRVITRLFEIEEEIDLPKVQEKIRALVEELLPDRDPWVIMEALIELGAKVCTPRPDCLLCPLREECKAASSGRTLELPKKKKRASVTELFREVYVIEYGDAVLVQQHKGRRVMADLFEFPYAEGDVEFAPFPLEKVKDLKPVTHTFTRYRARLNPTLWRAKHKGEASGYQWVAKEQLQDLPFSSGHRRILGQLLEEYADSTH